MHSPTAIIEQGFRQPFVRSTLAASLALGLALPAVTLAPTEAQGQTGNVTIEATEGNASVTYQAYRIFTADVEGANTIKNVAWASSTTRTAVVDAIKAVDSSYTDPSNAAESAQKAAEFIQQHIAGSNGVAPSQESDLILESGTFGMLLADATDELASVAILTPGTTATLEGGYYLFVTNTTSITTAQAGTSPIFTAVGADAVTITEKTTVPTVAKRALDEAGAEQSAVDAFVGQAVTYELIGTLPANIDSYATYSYRFTDVLDKGLTADLSSVKVTIDNVDCTSKFTKELTDNTLEVGAKDLLTVADITANSVVRVTYSAVLNSKAVIGATGNDNAVKLTYGSNPNTTATTTSKEQRVRTYTYELDIHKQDKQAANRSLEGAEFTMQVVENANASLKGKYVQADGSLGDSAYRFKTDSSGNLSISGIDQGVYLVSEVATPQIDNGSYEAISPVTVTIDSNVEELGAQGTAQQTLSLSATVTGDADAVIAKSVDTAGSAVGNGINAQNGTVNLVVRDTKRTLMPQTGDAGIALPCLIAVGALGVSAFALRARRGIRSNTR